MLVLSTAVFSYQTIVKEVKGKEQITVLENEKLIARTEIEQEKKSSPTLAPLQLKVVLKRIYLDGETSEEVIKQTIWSMDDFWAQYEDWQLLDQKEGQVTFKQHIDDISPLLKANGYFGIDQEGRLSIYKGNPAADEVIQSFFQIDLEKLESKLKEQLKEGIVIISKDQYSQLLQSLKEYEVR
ncbi:regulator [Lottiidibacillus patelloidae]|uniref:Regulator n=2 Tax=Lottiidibacillus patelloidae TaxID=2670334 RepID=A0A263BWS5_9BACI|nr:regulator [Lottiidibacillus patelloidae]